MKVLSIDFDYFQDVTRDDVADYPDGLDLPPALSADVWASHYAYKESLSSLKLNENEIRLMKNILLEQKRVKSVKIALSHKDIYQHIKDEYDGSGLDVVNVDMHHDMFNDNPELDCGNWGFHVIKDFNASFSWVANKISKECYGMTGEEFGVIKESLSEIAGEQFDLIFLCRSDNWLPPHFDKEFTTLAKTLISLSIIKNYDCMVQKSALEPRQYDDTAKTLKKMRDKMYHDAKKKRKAEPEQY